MSNEEVQLDELDVLRAIYGDDFEDVETKTAWSRATERSFKIRLTSNLDNNVSIVLNVTLSSTYPKSVPLLRLTGVDNLRPNSLARIHAIVKSRPKELLPSGEVMIFQIASEMQDILDDEVSARARDEQLPSLEEERAVRAAAVRQAAEAEQLERVQREEAARLQAETESQRKVDEEVRKREEARLELQSKMQDRKEDEIGVGPFEQVAFDQAVSFKDELRNQSHFRSVYLFRSLARDVVHSVFTATPTTTQPRSTCFILKRYTLPVSSSRDSILNLERLLERLRHVHHASITNLLAFKLTNENTNWHCDILTDFATRGSLTEMLDMVGEIPTQRARTYFIELLQAVDFLHKHGIVHGRIHSGNVLFTSGHTGIANVKLADAGFVDFIADLGESRKPSERSNTSWIPPESLESPYEKTRRTDIWELGVVLVEMLLGLDITKTRPTPSKLLDEVAFSGPLEDLLIDIFDKEPRKRPGAFEIVPYEFLRTDCPALLNSIVASKSRTVSSGQATTHTPRRFVRSESSTALATSSRYSNEWEEVGRLGKGGYGEVVKARNKLDGRIYAVKKITQKLPSELNQVLSEVYLLATLNHPYVVRYFTCWPEEDEDRIVDDSEYTGSTTGDGIVFETGSSDSEDSDFNDPMTQSTGGLDFISSSGYPRIDFAEDDDDREEVVDSSDEESSGPTTTDRASAALSFRTKKRRAKSFSRPALRSTLYIQMEYCERLTLRDMIRKNIGRHADDVWRLFRQVLEGLVHIHSHGIIHRDLKPENIFIDVANNPRIGDFGLATSGQRFIDIQQEQPSLNDDMTRDVGTTLYVAPELRGKGSTSYTDKIDMYSLGIILFEMCYVLETAMERGQVLSAIREKEHRLPEVFQTSEKVLQGDIISSLITHRSGERPSSTQLLQSGKIPVQIEDETIRIALEGLADDNSPYHQKIMSALFSKSVNNDVKSQLYDHKAGTTPQPSANFLLLQSLVKERLAACFQCHGAVEVQRHGLFPRSEHYSDTTVVRLLDASGTLVQLPHDLTLPMARLLAKQIRVAEKSFVFGTVYRNTLYGTAPRSNREADFDIVSYKSNDLRLNEAEVIKVLDEVINAFPSLRRAQMCFHISHWNLLDIILDFCRIAAALRPQVKEVLGRLNINNFTWTKIRLELRSTAIGVSSTSLDELARFDFRDTPENCTRRIQSIFAKSEYLPQVQDILAQMIGLGQYCQRLGVKHRVYFSPLSNFNEKFYKNSIMFQCLFDTKKRDVLAAGGRYDSLVAEHAPRTTGTDALPHAHAVGFNLAWDTIVSSMMRYQRESGGSAFLKKGEEVDSQGIWATRRCDVLIASFEPSVLRSTGLTLVSKLWAHDISAEISVDVRSPEDLLIHYREDKHSWIITIKHEDIASDKPDLKVKSLEKRTDYDVRSSDIVNFLRAELRERDQREGSERSKLLHRQLSQHASSDLFSSTTSSSDRRTDVQVLLANHKSKKGNKWRVVEQAQQKAQDLLRSYADGPIACIETRDEVIEMIRETRLSDAESWKRVREAVNLSERTYIQEILELLQGFKAQYADAGGGAGSAGRNCFVFNFRTGLMILYDLCL